MMGIGRTAVLKGGFLMRYWLTVLWIPFLVFISIMVTLIRKRFHREEKIDQGFVFFFWKLSSRRKFIRTLWLLPLFLTALILVQITFEDHLFTAVIGSEILLVFIVQLAYYYVKWKSDKQSSQSDQ